MENTRISYKKSSATSRCILVIFEKYEHPKYVSKKVLVMLFLYICHIKTKWNKVYEYLKTKIFGQSATTIGVLGVSLNCFILNFKKTKRYFKTIFATLFFDS